MKRLKTTAIFLFFLISSCSQKNNNVEYKKPENQLEKFSYSIGVNIATTIKEKHNLTLRDFCERCLPGKMPQNCGHKRF